MKSIGSLSIGDKFCFPGSESVCVLVAVITDGNGNRTAYYKHLINPEFSCKASTRVIVNK